MTHRMTIWQKTARDVAARQGLPLEVFRTVVGNAGAARNIGLSHVGGRFVFFLDADDEIVPGSLARLLATLQGDRAAQLAIGGNIRRTDGRPDKLKLPQGYTRDRAENARAYLTNRLWPIAMGSALAYRELAVEPQQVVLGESEAADGRL
jgi:glycosyltransferase involved in cell wall biosynthesis